MADELIHLPDLEAALAAVYRGPIEEFVSRRDTLVKQLRALKRRDDADLARALRKPSRLAWVLNTAVADDPESVERLAAVVRDALGAQAGGGDLRGALDNVRAAVRALADQAVRSAAANGYPIESSALVPALMAVLGESDAFAALRAARLADIPPGGGLDFLTAAPPAGAPAAPQQETPQPAVDVEAEAAARAETERADAALDAARQNVQVAEAAVAQAKARLEAAEQQRRRAEAEENTRRGEYERARQDASTAAARLREAEQAASSLRAGRRR